MNKMGRGEGACIFDRAWCSEVNFKCWKWAVSCAGFCYTTRFWLTVTPTHAVGWHELKQEALRALEVWMIVCFVWNFGFD